MECRSLCDIKKEICSEAALINETPTTFTVSIDAHGNIDFTDPNSHFIPVYSEEVGNLSGTGSLIQRFSIDPHVNLKYNSN